MGINFLGSSSFLENEPYEENNKSLPNPDPSNYAIHRFREIDGHLVILVQYLDCLNYEGMKIMVYENCTKKDLTDQKFIDPHFTDNKKYKSPVARFQPDESGWKMAIDFTKTLKKYFNS